MAQVPLLSALGSRSDNLPEQVYNILREQIVHGELTPGERLTEMEIASRLGVSRTPVREALLGLFRDGLLVKNGRSFALRALSRDDIREVYELRRLLEPTAVELAARTARAADLNELARSLADQHAAHAAADFQAFVAANARFRATLFGLSDNRRLRAAIELNNDHLRFISVRLNQPHWRAVTLKNQDALLLAMKAKDGAAAAKAWMTAIDDSDDAGREWFNELNAQSSSGALRRKQTPPKRAQHKKKEVQHD